jgi:hypothetical protein
MAEATPATTMAAWDDALKQYYIDKKPMDVAYGDHPFLQMIPKQTRFRGKNMPLPILYARPQGRSATFATAQSNATSSSLGEFLLTRVKNYAVVTVDGETIEASRGNEYSFLEALTTETDMGLKTLGDTLSRQMFRSQSGAIGVVGATPAANTNLDLATDADSLSFEVGMKVIFTDATDTGSTRDSSKALTVAAVNRMAASNQITLTANLNSVTGVASGDFIVPEGDLVTPGTYLCMAGLQDWIPASAPGATAFFGQDRTADTTRLGGQRQAFDTSIKQTILEAAMTVGREGGKPDVCFLSYADWATLELSLDAQVSGARQPGPAQNFGFRTLQVIGPHGPIDVVPDKDCPTGSGYLLQLDTWALYSMGDAVQILSHDGQRMLRQNGFDGVEIRMGGYYQMGCRAPGYNCYFATA